MDAREAGVPVLSLRMVDRGLEGCGYGITMADEGERKCFIYCIARPVLFTDEVPRVKMNYDFIVSVHDANNDLVGAKRFSSTKKPISEDKAGSFCYDITMKKLAEILAKNRQRINDLGDKLEWLVDFTSNLLN